MCTRECVFLCVRICMCTSVSMGISNFGLDKWDHPWWWWQCAACLSLFSVKYTSLLNGWSSHCQDYTLHRSAVFSAFPSLLSTSLFLPFFHHMGTHTHNTHTHICTRVCVFSFLLSLSLSLSLTIMSPHAEVTCARSPHISIAIVTHKGSRHSNMLC